MGTGPLNLLLDTHVFFWWRINEARLLDTAREAIADADAVLVSIASAWEAAIKVSLGKLRIDGSFSAGVEHSRFQALPVTFDHVDRVSALPRHHRDPFDRMLIAQALVEDLTIVTGDRRFAPYGVRVVWT
jgi:PIN domain nuclease of toxin-antitoxin system